jgi:hypothetical protein
MFECAVRSSHLSVSNQPSDHSLHGRRGISSKPNSRFGTANPAPRSFYLAGNAHTAYLAVHTHLSDKLSEQRNQNPEVQAPSGPRWVLSYHRTRPPSGSSAINEIRIQQNIIPTEPTEFGWLSHSGSVPAHRVRVAQSERPVR